jgi:hypothetical protein
MLGEVGLAETEVVLQVADASLTTVTERHHDAQPYRMSQGFEDLRLRGGWLHQASRLMRYSVFRIYGRADRRQ